MTDDAAALAVQEVFRILRQYEDSRMVDSVEAERSILARLAALPAHPPAPPEPFLDPEAWYAAFEKVNGFEAKTPEGRLDLFREFREAYLVAWGRALMVAAPPTPLPLDEHLHIPVVRMVCEKCGRLLRRVALGEYVLATPESTE